MMKGGRIGDRFIPAKAGFDWDLDYTTIGSSDDKLELYSDYQLRIAEALNQPPTRRYFVFNSKPPTPTQRFPKPCPAARPAKRERIIPQTPSRTMEFVSPDVFDDDNFILNLLDWAPSPRISIALGNSVCLWDESCDDETELITLEDHEGPVTSVKWAPDGDRIAVGLGSSGVHLLDAISCTRFASLNRSTPIISSMDWLDDHVLTTGALISQIVDNDLRVRHSAVQTYRGHRKQVCALKWSPSGQQLASGGADNLLYIWDRRKSSRWLHKIEQHTSAVRALAWCPFETHLLASGGDHSIKFWNTSNGASLNSVETGSEVCSLLWNYNERELLSSHGSPHNQLALWKYPSMEKRTELTWHTSRVLYMAPSPGGCSVAAAADGRLTVWKVFGTPRRAKPKPAPREPFQDFPRIR